LHHSFTWLILDDIQVNFVGDVHGMCSTSTVVRRVHFLVESAFSTSRCIVCCLCSWWCPVDCLFVGSTRSVRRSNFCWTIDRKRCVFCGNCGNVCPVLAITQTGTWTLSDRTQFVALKCYRNFGCCDKLLAIMMNF